MSQWRRLKEDWLQPFFFYGNNPLSLIGGALTSASAFVLIGFWVVSIFGHAGSANPYIGIVLDLFLPGLFILGLILIPIGIWLHRRHLIAAGQVPATYPTIDLRNAAFRHGIEVVVIATFINFVIVGTATYRGVSYMDSPNFCGQSCHVMAPQWAAYQESPHSHVECVQCHVGSGFKSYVHAKINGTKQLVEVTFHDWPTPIRANLNTLRPARETCEACHSPTRFVGEKLLVKTTFGDDQKNSMTRTVLVLHLGGVDSVSHLTGIHGHHLNNFEYVATDNTLQTIIAVTATNPDGSKTEYISSDAQGARRGRPPHDGLHRLPQPGHSRLPVRRRSRRRGHARRHSESQPTLRPQGRTPTDSGELLLPGRSRPEDRLRPRRLLPQQYPQIWSSQRAQIDASAQRLVAIYDRNVFPSMKITWGTYPNNIGHMAYPGCFRCHDGSHTSKDGKTLSNDCSLCHNLLATDETHPNVLNDLQLQNEIHLQ